jgi:hypothetical protein
MVWRAYAGLSGAVVLSVVVLALTMGMPTKSIMQVAGATSAVMLGGAMFATLCFMAFRKRRVRR